MIYDFACDDCRVITQVERPIQQAGEQATCEWCGQPMRRIFYAPRLLNRGKPGGFRHDKGKLNGWDDRIARLRYVEQTEGSAGLKRERGFLGKVYNMTLAHYKQRYAS